MGQTTADTVREIEQTRARLGEEVGELQARLPSPSAVAKKAATVAGTTVAGTTLGLLAIKRIRKRRARRRYPEPVQRVVEVLPDGWMSAIQKANGPSWPVVVGGVLFLMRLAELRRLRAIARAIDARM